MFKRIVAILAVSLGLSLGINSLSWAGEVFSIIESDEYEAAAQTHLYVSDDGYVGEIKGISGTESHDIEGAVAAIEKALLNWEAFADLSGYGITTNDSISDIYFTALYRNPYIFYTTFRYSCTVSGTASDGSSIIDKIIFEYDRRYTRDSMKAFQAKVDEVMAEIDSNWSDVQKALFIHDYLVTNCQYDFGQTNISAYTALIDGITVCQGYAKAYKLLMELCGIETSIISSEGLKHAWNAVRIGDRYFYVDCTYDEGGSRAYPGLCMHKSFLKSREGIIGTGHQYEDWVDCETGLNAYSGLSTGTEYDDAYWENVYTGIEMDGAYSVYIEPNYTDYHIMRFDNGSLDKEVFFDFRDVVSANITSIHKHVIAHEGDYIVSDMDCIFSVNSEDKSVTVLHRLTDEEKSKGWIYDLRLKNGKLTYYLYQAYDAEESGRGIIVLSGGDDSQDIDNKGSAKPSDEQKDEGTVPASDEKGDGSSEQPSDKDNAGGEQPQTDGKIELTPQIRKSVSAQLGSSGYTVIYTASVSYNGRRHIQSHGKSGKKKSADLDIRVLDNTGREVDRSLYTVKFKNNRDASVDQYGKPLSAAEGTKPFFTIKFKNLAQYKIINRAIEGNRTKFDIFPATLTEKNLIVSKKPVLNGRGFKNHGKFRYRCWDGYETKMKRSKLIGRSDYELEFSDDGAGIVLVGNRNYCGTVKVDIDISKNIVPSRKYFQTYMVDMP